MEWCEWWCRAAVCEEEKEQEHVDEAAELAALNDEDLAEDMEAARL